MKTNYSLYRLAVAPLLATTLFLVTGCARHLSGKYTDQYNTTTLEFKGDKVYYGSLFGGKILVPYHMKGNDVLIKGPGGELLLQLEKDGTLSGFPTGTLHKVE